MRKSVKRLLTYEDVQEIGNEADQQLKALCPDPQALLSEEFVEVSGGIMKPYFETLGRVSEPIRLIALLEEKGALVGRVRKEGWPDNWGEMCPKCLFELAERISEKEWPDELVEIYPESRPEVARQLVACLPPIKVFGDQQRELREEAEAHRKTQKDSLRELFVEGLFLAIGELATPQRIRLREKWVRREGRVKAKEPRLLGVYEYLHWFNARAGKWARDLLGRLEAPAQKGKRPCPSCGKTELLAGKAQICPACGVGMPGGWSSLTWDKPMAEKDLARPPRFPSTPETDLEEKSLWAALDAFLRPEEQALCKSLQAGASDEEIATTLGLSPVNERKRRQRLKEKIKAFLLS